MANEANQSGVGNVIVRDVRDATISISQTFTSKPTLFPFKLIWKTRQLFGSPDRIEAFAPAQKEYTEGLVHRTGLADEVERRLTTHGWAWVRGRGAAGKTVLAIQLALGYQAKGLPAYYLNLAETDAEVAEALSALTTHAHEQAIFIVDNVHLDEGFACDLFDHWQESGTVSHLFLLGRETTVKDVRGAANPLEPLLAEALTLTVTSADLLGVLRRLMRRLQSSSTECPLPPDTNARMAKVVWR